MSRLRRENSRQSVITVELIQFIIQYRAKELLEKRKRCALVKLIALDVRFRSFVDIVKDYSQVLVVSA